MKSLIMLWSKIAEDFAIRCHTSATMDIKTVQGRTKHEGLSFLTITLPAFAKEFQKSLDNGLVSDDSFLSFKKRTGLPQFLGGFLQRVFSPYDAVLLDEPDIEAILAVRQLTLIYSKLLLPCTPARIQGAIDGYVECDREVKSVDRNMSSNDYLEFKRMSNLLFRDVFSHLDKLVHDEEVVPKHGPGATADNLFGNEKYRNRTWTSRLQQSFSSENFLLPNPRYADESGITYLEPGEELPVRVVPVPKTLKTPRIIAIEPSYVQYAQQAVLGSMVPALESHWLTKHFLGFSDQLPNQELAKQGSRDGRTATLDLSEASDRVSNQLVRTMFSDFPHLFGAVQNSRTRTADVPGHGKIRLAKFASMGSALCFPVEAMVFLTLIFLGIEKELSTRFSDRSQLMGYIGRVRVYGDDLVVPVDCVESVITTLGLFGARVGGDKSFWIGRFRESCGKEYYDGEDVSIVRCRRVFPSSLKNAPECISIVSLRNQLYLAGCWSAVEHLDSKIRKVFKYFPVVEESSEILGRTSFLSYQGERTCPNLHRPLVKGYVARAVIPKSPLGDVSALLKCLLQLGSEPGMDVRHLERSGRPRAVDIKPRWTTPF